MFFDTDCAGVVHNIAYLRFIETARTHLLAKIGLDLKSITENQLFPARRPNRDRLSSARHSR